MDVGAWLRGLGLERYEQAFRDNHVDGDVLPNLSADDLKELGVASLGHRKRLLEAIALAGQGGAAAGAQGGGQAERRQLTVLFSDLVGSTALSARLDPEDMRDVVRTYREATAAVVGRYDGHLAKLLGDGVLVYFGWPRAHEDDAERAVRAGLEIVEGVGALEVHASRLRARVGIATGLVVAGDMLGAGVSEPGAVSGETPNLAARLQALAEPGGVVISEATHRLAGGLFECRDLGARDLKGFGAPVRAWAAMRPRRAESRFDVLRAEGLTALVGRGEEVELLTRRWRQAETGDGRVVLISGEPGIGKSRLVRTLQERIVGEAYTPVRLQCSPFHTNSALHPMIEELERSAGWSAGDGAQAKLGKLEMLLASSGGADAETTSALAALLSLPSEGRSALPELSPEQQKQQALDALCGRLMGLAALRPVLLVLEDAHWIDPTTLELTELVVARIRHAPMLAIITCRPEFRAPWSGRPRVELLSLGRLDRRASALMVDRVPGALAISTELRERIVERADGVPLFVEELTRSIVETERLQASSAAIPATLRDLLSARLDGLGQAKEAAQVGAAIGRSFAYRMIRRASLLTEPELRAALERLVASGLVQHRGEPPGALYIFKHALVQDAAYESLLRSERERVHLRIARAFEQEHPQVAATQPELLAHHHTAARQLEPAAGYWTAAAQLAFNRSAMKEAIGHATKGLEVVASLPEGEARLRPEARLQAILALALKASTGIAHPDTERAFERAHALARGLADQVLIFPALYGLWHAHWFQGHLERASQEARQLLDLAASSGTREELLAANSAMGFSLVHVGENAQGMAHLERMHALYEPATDAGLVFRYMVEFGVIHGFCTAVAQLALGYPDAALRQARDGIALARARQPINLCAALNFGGHVPLSRGEPETALAWADEALALSEANGFQFISAFAQINRGWARAQLGQVAVGIADIRSGIAAWRTSGSGLWLSRHLVLLAEACLIDQRPEEAAGVADEALAVIGQGGERHFESCALAAKGDALRAAGASTAEAERCYLDAIDVAHTQLARFWELRAATRLASLWHAQGGTAQARGLLRPLYDWFTEGFATRDLRSAKALLDELT